MKRSFGLLSGLSALLAVGGATTAFAGVHVGNLHLATYDDGSPYVTLDPTDTPRLALLTCGESTPWVISAQYDNEGKPYFSLDADIGDVCAVGLDLGSPLDLLVGGVKTADGLSPAVIGFAISATPVDDLVGATLRVGTATMMSQVRAIAAVPRAATSSEESQIESALSTLTLDLP
ncbi:MAG TPA: hypothetical protein PKA64_24380 [Myxococcota bacterium]|nr:hypothetical protein [Myxococcota bacterium]